MSAFERYLTLWVGLCIVVGIALGHFFAPAFQMIGAAEIANVNLPVAGAECRRVSANGWTRPQLERLLAGMNARPRDE